MWKTNPFQRFGAVALTTIRNDLMPNTTGPFHVVVTKDGRIRILDARTGLGWTLTNEEARQLVNAITRKLGDMKKG
jgi:hypothetical protein